MSEAEGVGIAVRAELHALDAALAEQRRALAMAASRREAERMARARDVKAASNPAVRRLAGELGDDEPLLALALAGSGGTVAAVTPRRLLLTSPSDASARPPSTPAPEGLVERRPGRLAAALALVVDERALVPRGR